QLAEELGITKRVIWAGARADMPAVYNALDLLLSTSLSEGFPNVVGEAMACGIPCIVTDVGDAGYLVHNTEMVVPSGDAAALAQAGLKLLNHDRLDFLKQQVYERIQQCFTGAKLAEKTADALMALRQ
ncbi:MAG: glycosyltransferase, partial [Anaerolineales bacterium]|nr:glycosyltransferase [Anaerolineales bacterium]